MKTDLITSLALLWGATGLFVADVRVVLAADGDRDSDFPQVLTPSRLPQRLDEAPSTVTLIDRAMIEASGARRLVDVLRLVPGLQLGYKNKAQHGFQTVEDGTSQRRTGAILDGL